MRSIEEIKQAIKSGSPADAIIEELTAIIAAHPDCDEAYLQRGLLYWRAGQRAKAINDYNKAVSINPDSEARLALKATYEILDFYNKDLYNP